jgi:hypothetical protein
VSKITLPLLEFPIARFPEETNDHFRVRVELTAENVVGSYNHGEHDTCIFALSNRDQLNRVFEQAGVSYGPHLEPGSGANKDAAKKRKNDVSAGPVGNRVKVYSKKAAALKPYVAPKGMGATSSKTASAHTKLRQNLVHRQRLLCQELRRHKLCQRLGCL